MRSESHQEARKETEIKHEVECVGANDKPQTRTGDCYGVSLDSLQQNSLQFVNIFAVTGEPKLDVIL